MFGIKEEGLAFRGLRGWKEKIESEGLPRPKEVMKNVAIEVIDKTTLPLRMASAVLDDTVREVIHKIKFSNPEPISREEAIEIISQSDWAQNWAKSMCSLAGITPTHPDYESCVERLSRRVAEKVV